MTFGKECAADDSVTAPAEPEHAGAKAALLNREVLALAAEQKWHEVADVVARRDALLARIPAQHRESALRAARNCTDKLNELAQAAKSRCREQLATLRQGRKAAASYHANRS
jgi:molybdopterin synthase catalytic subunit